MSAIQDGFVSCWPFAFMHTRSGDLLNEANFGTAQQMLRGEFERRPWTSSTWTTIGPEFRTLGTTTQCCRLPSFVAYRHRPQPGRLFQEVVAWTSNGQRNHGDMASRFCLIRLFCCSFYGLFLLTWIEHAEVQKFADQVLIVDSPSSCENSYIHHSYTKQWSTYDSTAQVFNDPMDDFHAPPVCLSATATAKSCDLYL